MAEEQKTENQESVGTPMRGDITPFMYDYANRRIRKRPEQIEYSFYFDGGLETTKFVTFKSYNHTSGAYSVSDSDFSIMCDASLSSLTVTLPTAVGKQGRIYVVKRKEATGGNTVTVNTFGSETIDGSSSVVITTVYSMMVQSDGVNWYTI